MKYENWIVMFLVFFMMGCTDDVDFSTSVPVPSPTVTIEPCPSPNPSPSPTVSPSPVPTDEATIQGLVETQNSYRQVLGEDPLAPGLICYLYTVPTTTSSIATATLTYVTSFGTNGIFNQPVGPVTAGLNIMPSALASQYQTWFVSKCEGSFVVAESNYYDFSLASDDGSILTIDAFTLNNDGLHSATTKTGTALLEEGVHGFELDFFQATGQQELVLLMNGSNPPAYMFYH